MLPLDKLSDKISAILTEQGVDVASADMCLKMDLNTKGDYGEVWLILSRADGNLYRVENDTVEAIPLAELTEPYIDNYTTSNRLQARRHAPEDKPPEQGDMSDDEFQKATKAYNISGTTIVLGYCTNAVKLRLLAFMSLWERLKRNETIADDDAIFDQFNRTCPKCGRLYKDPRNRICEHCVQRKGVMGRLMSYFLVFKKQRIHQNLVV